MQEWEVEDSRRSHSSRRVRRARAAHSLCVRQCAVALEWVEQGIFEGINSAPSESQSPRGTNKILCLVSNIQSERCEVVLRRKKHTGIKDKLEALMSGRCQGHKRFFSKGKKDVSSC